MGSSSQSSTTVITAAPPSEANLQYQPYRQQQEALFVDAVRAMGRVTEKTSWEAIKYLTLTNGTGAIALLGFMGNSHDVRQSAWAWAALLVYFIGIASVGVLIALQFHKGWNALSGLAKNGAAWRRGELTYEKVIAELGAGASSIAGPLCFAYGSFVCFIIGTLVAIIGR